MLLNEEVSCEREYKVTQHFTINTFSAEHVIQSNFYFLKFVGILLAAHVLISLPGFCVNLINIGTGTSKMVGIDVYSGL